MTCSTPLLRSLDFLLAGYGVPTPDLKVTGVEMDSRRVSVGDLFLACRGQGQQHGLDFLDQSLRRGASAIAWEPAAGWSRPKIPVPEIAVENLSRRAGEIAARFFGEPTRQMFTVGITGTDGKTSTAHLLAQALEYLAEPCAYVGTLGIGRLEQLSQATHTTPDPVSLQRSLAKLLEAGARAVAMEVSSHALDQDRISGVHLDAAVLTNVTRDHLDYHGTVERYAAAKRRLFERLPASGAILNRDDAHGQQWLQQLGNDAIAYGVEGPVSDARRHVIARQLSLHADGLSFELDTYSGAARINSQLLGQFNVYNLLAALSALLLKGVPLADAVVALEHCATVPGRIEGFRGAASRPLVVVDYAHTPQALEQILRAVRAHTQGKLFCVFGCGGDRDRGKRPLMAERAAKFADALIVTDDNPRSEKPQDIVNEILAGLPAGYPARVIHDRAQAITAAVNEAGAKDIVVVAGKGHESEQVYGSERRNFSDRKFVAQILEARVPA